MRAKLSHRDGEKLQRARGYHLQGAFTEAQALYEKLLKKHPRNPVVQSLLGSVLIDQGQPVAAIPILREATARKKNPDSHYNLALALDAIGDLQGAVREYRQAVALDADHSKAHFNLGLVYRRLEQYEQAIDSLLKDYAQGAKFDTCRLLARCYTQLERYDDALFYANQCVELDGATADDLDLLVFLLCHKYALTAYVTETEQDELVALAEHAVALNSSNVTALINAGRAHSQLGNYQAALAPLKQAVQLDPENESAHALYAVALLTEGEIYQGWHERTLLSRMQKPVTETGVRRWNGQLEAGLKLWVTREQGVGDQILYARMLRELVDAGVVVTLVCEARIQPLLARSFPQILLSTGLSPAEQAQQDAFTTLGELHMYLRADRQDLPAPANYLAADTAASERLRDQYQALYPDKVITGFAWRSHSDVNGAGKSIPLDDLLPILKTPNRVFVCVQYGDGWQELAAHAEQHGYTVHFDEDCNSLTDLDAGLAQLAALDDVVSVSNASVHMAAALGKKVRVLVGRRPVWHWFSQGDRSPWYSDVALYRQQTLTDWQAPIEQLAADLAGDRG